MKRPGLIVMILSCALMSSCSWAKHRYQWVKAHLPIPANKAARSASLVSIQPTRAQQAEAKRMLRTQQPPQEAPAAPNREQEFTQQLMLPEEHPSAPLPPQSRQMPTTAAAPQQAIPYSTPPQFYTLPSDSAVANPYANMRFVPRGAQMPPTEEPAATTAPEPDAAQMRGLRSPALPQALPMDIDGKLRTPSHL